MSIAIALLIVTNALNLNAKLEAQKTIASQQSQISELKSTLYVSNARASKLEIDYNKIWGWYKDALQYIEDNLMLPRTITRE